MTVHGSGGIPREGHAEAYATELWLENPLAFWLHPEGPLSDTTPEEWLAKQPKVYGETLTVVAGESEWILQGLSGSATHQKAFAQQMQDYWNTLLP